jgi:RimJ/RimL family protein N-acetyltransferase
MPTFGSAETVRLRLEPWDHERHGPGLAAVHAHPDVGRYVAAGEAITRADSDDLSTRIQTHWETYGFGLWAAVPKDTGALIGFIGLCHPLWFPAMVDRVEIGWRLGREAGGAGYATEGAREALRRGFDTLALDEIMAFVHPENARSLAVWGRLRMVEETELPHPARDHAIKVLRVARPCSSW